MRRKAPRYRDEYGSISAAEAADNLIDPAWASKWLRRQDAQYVRELRLAIGPVPLP